ncbi:MAG: RNA polymerase sigma factor, partial [Mycobacteriales bacterium]
IDRIEDPDRLGAWLATTARRECLRLIARSRRTTPVAAVEALADSSGPPAPAPDSALLARERDEQVREAVALLPPHCRRLLEQLMADPRPSYSEIADRLQMPIGSIGPTRGRCLRRLQELLGPAGQAGAGTAVWEAERT